MYKIIHPKCGGTSFYILIKPEINKPIEPKHVLYPDGSRPDYNELAMCGTCGEYAECVEANLVKVTDPIEINLVNELVEILDIEEMK